MNKKIFIFLIFIALLTSVSCSKNIVGTDLPPDNYEKETEKTEDPTDKVIKNAHLVNSYEIYVYDKLDLSDFEKEEQIHFEVTNNNICTFIDDFTLYGVHNGVCNVIFYYGSNTSTKFYITVKVLNHSTMLNEPEQLSNHVYILEPFLYNVPTDGLFVSEICNEVNDIRESDITSIVVSINDNDETIKELDGSRYTEFLSNLKRNKLIYDSNVNSLGASRKFTFLITTNIGKVYHICYDNGYIISGNKYFRFYAFDSLIKELYNINLQ